MRSIVTPFLEIQMVKRHTEMEEGFRNWNNDDSRTEGLDRRMNTIDY